MMPKPSDGSSLTRGLQVSELILRERAMLQSSSDLTYSSREEPNPAALQRQRVIKQAQTVKEQMRKILPSSPTLPNQAGKQMGAKPFEFQKLPPEIRDMIYAYAFANSSGKKPTLLFALRNKELLYKAARKIYFQIIEFRFTVKQTVTESFLDKMETEEVKSMRNFKLVIGQACSQLISGKVVNDMLQRKVVLGKRLSSLIVKATNIENLILSVPSDHCLRLVIHEVVPAFQKLKTVTVCIQKQKALETWDQSRISRASPLDSYYQAIRMLDKMLGQGGVRSKNKTQFQWVWDVRWSGSKNTVFKPVCPKVHIKFD